MQIPVGGICHELFVHCIDCAEAWSSIWDRRIYLLLRIYSFKHLFLRLHIKGIIKIVVNA